jgi:MFS transporter, PPP family, 3-phenylpropionic acid transporter
LNSIALLTIIIALVFAAIGISTPLVTLYLQSLGADYSRIAVILATTAAVSLVSSYFWGRASDVLGRRKPLIAGGLAGAAAAYFLLSQVTGFDGAWAVRLGEAAAMAAYSTASLALMGDLLSTSSARGKRMGTYRGIGSLAFAGGALIGGRLADAYSLRAPFVFAAVFYLMAALLALTLREPRRITPADAPGPTRQPTVFRLPSSAFRLGLGLPWLFLAGVFLWQMTWNGQASMWPNYMASLGYAKTAISSLWGLAGLIEAPSMLLAGQLSDVIGRAVLLAAGGVGASLVMLGYLLLSGIFLALLGVQIIRGMTFGSYTANAMTFAVESGDERMRGANSGLLNTVSGAGQLVGLYLGGTLVQGRGFPFMWMAFAVTALLSAVCFAALRRNTTQKRNPK